MAKSAPPMGIGEALAAQIDQITEAANALGLLSSSVCKSAEFLVDALNDLKAALPDKSFDQLDMATFWSKYPGGWSYKARYAGPAQDQLTPLWRQRLEDNVKVLRLLKDLNSKYSSALQAANAFIADLPSTTRNTKLKGMLEARLKESTKDFNEINAALPHFSTEEQGSYR